MNQVPNSSAPVPPSPRHLSASSDPLIWWEFMEQAELASSSSPSVSGSALSPLDPTHSPPPYPFSASSMTQTTQRQSWLSGRSKWAFRAGPKGGGGADSSPPRPRKRARIVKDQNEAMNSSNDIIDADITVHKDDTSPYRVFDGETAEEYFKRTLENSTQAEIFLEYLIFLKSLPNLQSNDLQRIRDTVRSELNINLIEDNISMIDLRFVSESPEHHPILDALACKLGYSLTIITPPTELCLLCDQRITRRNPNRKPTQVSLFTLTGPKIASKLTWTCRNCKGASRLNGSESENVNYYPDRFGNDTVGYKFYPNSVQTQNITEASQESYFENSVLRGYWEEFCHGWLSCEGKCEAYNMAHSILETTKSIERFLTLNKAVGKHFDKVNPEAKNLEEEDSDVAAGRATRMYQMKRKSLGQAIRNWCVVQELKERHLLSTVDGGELFGPILEDGRTIPFKARDLKWLILVSAKSYAPMRTKDRFRRKSDVYMMHI